MLGDTLCKRPPSHKGLISPGSHSSRQRPWSIMTCEGRGLPKRACIGHALNQNCTAQTPTNLKLLPVSIFRIITNPLYRELRMELSLPGFGLHDLSYPGSFPSPPSTFSGEDSARPWYYYLAEISLRRLANRILYHLFQNEDRGRFPNIFDMVESTEAFEGQAADWYVFLIISPFFLVLFLLILPLFHPHQPLLQETTCHGLGVLTLPTGWRHYRRCLPLVLRKMAMIFSSLFFVVIFWTAMS